MDAKDLLTNRFTVTYDESSKELLVTPNLAPNIGDQPIRLKLSVLKDMGPEGASKWVGETIMLLVPELRASLFDLPEEK